MSRSVVLEPVRPTYVWSNTYQEAPGSYCYMTLGCTDIQWQNGCSLVSAATVFGDRPMLAGWEIGISRRLTLQSTTCRRCCWCMLTRTWSQPEGMRYRMNRPLAAVAMATTATSHSHATTAGKTADCRAECCSVPGLRRGRETEDPAFR